MGLYATPLVSDYQQFTPTDTVTALKDPRTGGAFKIGRVPSWRGSVCLDPPATTPKVYVRLADASGNGGGSDSNGGTSWSDAYATINKASTAIQSSGTDKVIMVGGPAADGGGEAWLRDQLASGVLSAHVAGMYRCKSGTTETIIHFSGSDIFTGWSGPDSNGFYSHAYTAPHLPTHGSSFSKGTLKVALTASGTDNLVQQKTGSGITQCWRAIIQLGQGTIRGWYAKIDNEIVWVSAAGTKANGYPLTVTRGCRGTTIAAHDIGATINELAWPTDHMRVDGVPYTLALDGRATDANSCGAGEFFVDDAAAKIYMKDSPAGKTVTVTTRATGASGAQAGLNNNTAFKDGFVLDGFIVEDWAGPSENTGGGVLTFLGTGCQMSHCVIAYSTWLAVYMGGTTDYVERSNIFMNNMMDRAGTTIKNADLGYYQCRDTNWSQLINIGPSEVARWASMKLTNVHSAGSAGSHGIKNHHYLIFNANANATWYDIKSQAMLDYMLFISGAMGYGYTAEVSGGRPGGDPANPLDRPTVAGFWIENCGHDHGTNIRCSGIQWVQFVNGAAVNAGPGANCLLIDEDTREYAGPEQGCRLLDGTTVGSTGATAPGLGDTYDARVINCVAIKADSNENSTFDSFTGSVPPFGGESAGSGWAQRYDAGGTTHQRLLSAPEMFSHDVNASPLGQPVKSITAISVSSGVATITVGTHPWKVGEYVFVSGVNPGAYNGAWLITAITATQVKVLIAGSPGAYVSGGLCRYAPGDHHNVWGDLASAAGTKIFRWGNNTGGAAQQSMAALQALADGAGHVYGHEVASIEIIPGASAGKHLPDYFTQLATPGTVATWWGLSTIPTDGSPTGGAALPAALADLIEAPGTGDRFVKLGPPATIPWPQQLGSSTFAFVTPGTLDDATIGSNYGPGGAGLQLVTSGGTGTVSFVASGLAGHGLALSGVGLLTGIATGTLAYDITFTVTATDQSSPAKTATLNATIHVNAAGAPYAITTTALHDAQEGVSYTPPVTLATTGGTGSDTFSASGLPAAMTVTGAVVGGTPNTGTATPAGSPDSVVITATDGFSTANAKPNAVCATTGPLPANTLAAGVITASANGTLTVDGRPVILNDIVLVKDEATQTNNGLFKCTQAGSASAPFKLTRDTSMDGNAEVPFAYVSVTGGTTNAGSAWAVDAAGPYTLGTTAIIWHRHKVQRTLTLAVTSGDQPPTVAWNDTPGSGTPADNSTISATVTPHINASDDHTLPVHAAELVWGHTSTVGSGTAKPNAVCATTGPLPANNATSTTLTATANGALGSIDGHTIILNDIVLVKDEASKANNGLFKCTQAGDSTHPWVLTREATMDTGAEIPDAHVLVTQGSTYAGIAFAVISTGTYTLGTTPISWTRLTFTFGSGTNWALSLDSTLLADGNLWFAVKVTDSIGQTSTTAARKWTINNTAPRTAPTCNILVPAAGATVQGDGLAIGGTITDTTDPPSAITGHWSIIDSTNQVKLSGTLSYGFGWVAQYDSTDLADGTYTAYISGTNSAGQTGTSAGAAFTVRNGGVAAFRPDHNAVGYNISTLGASDTTNHSAVKSALTTVGARLNRIVVSWPTIQPSNPGTSGPGANDALDSTALADLDAMVADAVALGQRLVLCVTDTPGWARPSTGALPAGVTWGALTHVAPEREPGNGYPDLANVAWLLADRYGKGGTKDANGALAAIEVWNEPNTENWMQPDGTGTRGNTNHYGPDAGRYAQAVIGVYAAVHDGVVTHRTTRTAHPEILVLAGATGPATASGGPSGQTMTPGSFFVTFLAVPGAADAFDHASHHPSGDGVIYAGTL